MRPRQLLAPVGRLAFATALLLSGIVTAAAASLQQMIDAAADNATVAPPAGVYREHVVIRKPVVLDGSAGVVLDGGGSGTVLEIATSGVTVKSLTLRNSGRLHNQIDAGLRVKGDFNVVKDVKIENSLFGIDLHQANNNILRRNTIDGQGIPADLRGDSIRLWYSTGNEISENHILNSRDFVIWYSSENKIVRNRIHDSRYGIHFMYGHRNKMSDNDIANCVVGVFLMYSNDNAISRNRIVRAWGASGMGVGLKDSSGAVLADNEIVGNAIGISLDLSPSDPETPNTFAGNRLAFNGVGISFNNDWEGNIFEANAISSNFTQVAVGGGGTALREEWKHNYWDDYSGFDRDGDGHGDGPYEIYNYADRLWMEVPSTSFFRGAPSMELLDFIERLAPFSEPRLLIREPGPLLEAPALAKAETPKSALEMLQ